MQSITATLWQSKEGARAITQKIHALRESTHFYISFSVCSAVHYYYEV
jgi:hypothetical protein